MELGDIFDSAWQDYKGNFGKNVKLMFLYVILPLLILIGILATLGFQLGLIDGFVEMTTITANAPDGDIDKLDEEGKVALDAIFDRLLKPFLIFLAIALPLSFVAFLISMYGRLGVLLLSGKKKYDDVLKETKKKYWGFVGSSVLFVLAMVLLFVGGIVLATIGIISFAAGPVLGTMGLLASLLIGGVIFTYFGIGWMFGPYTNVFGNVKPGSSLSAGSSLVKNRRWIVIGYTAVIMIFVSVISFVLDLFTNLISLATSYGGSVGSVLLAYSIAKIFTKVLSTLFITPYLLLFFRQFYLSLKKEKN